MEPIHHLTQTTQPTPLKVDKTAQPINDLFLLVRGLTIPPSTHGPKLKYTGGIGYMEVYYLCDVPKFKHLCEPLKDIFKKYLSKFDISFFTLKDVIILSYYAIFRHILNNTINDHKHYTEYGLFVEKLNRSIELGEGNELMQLFLTLINHSKLDESSKKNVGKHLKVLTMAIGFKELFMNTLFPAEKFHDIERAAQHIQLELLNRVDFFTQFIEIVQKEWQATLGVFRKSNTELAGVVSNFLSSRNQSPVSTLKKVQALQKDLDIILSYLTQQFDALLCKCRSLQTSSQPLTHVKSLYHEMHSICTTSQHHYHRIFRYLLDISFSFAETEGEIREVISTIQEQRQSLIDAVHVLHEGFRQRQAIALSTPWTMDDFLPPSNRDYNDGQRMVASMEIILDMLSDIFLTSINLEDKEIKLSEFKNHVNRFFPLTPTTLWQTEVRLFAQLLLEVLDKTEKREAQYRKQFEFKIPENLRHLLKTYTPKIMIDNFNLALKKTDARFVFKRMDIMLLRVLESDLMPREIAVNRAESLICIARLCRDAQLENILVRQLSVIQSHEASNVYANFNDIKSLLNLKQKNITSTDIDTFKLAITGITTVFMQTNVICIIFCVISWDYSITWNLSYLIQP